MPPLGLVSARRVPIFTAPLGNLCSSALDGVWANDEDIVGESDGAPERLYELAGGALVVEVSGPLDTGRDQIVAELSRRLTLTGGRV